MRRALVVLLLAATSACGHQDAPRRPAAPTLPPVLSGVGGRVVVTDLDAVRLTPGGAHCVVQGPHADVAAGAVVDLSGTRRGSEAARTQLGQGTLRDGSGHLPAGCVFEFSTENVPNRHPAFLVRVADEPPVRVEAIALATGRALIRIPR